MPVDGFKHLDLSAHTDQAVRSRIRDERNRTPGGKMRGSSNTILRCGMNQ